MKLIKGLFLIIVGLFSVSVVYAASTSSQTSDGGGSHKIAGMCDYTDAYAVLANYTDNSVGTDGTLSYYNAGGKSVKFDISIKYSRSGKTATIVYTCKEGCVELGKEIGENLNIGSVRYYHVKEYEYDIHAGYKNTDNESEGYAKKGECEQYDCVIVAQTIGLNGLFQAENTFYNVGLLKNDFRLDGKQEQGLARKIYNWTYCPTRVDVAIWTDGVNKALPTKWGYSGLVLGYAYTDVATNLTKEYIDMSEVAPTDPENESDQKEFEKAEKAENGKTTLACSAILGDDVNNSGQPIYWIHMALEAMKYVAIILLIMLSMFDFIQAVAAQDNDALKKALSKSFKRIIYVVLIFFAPLALEYIFKLFGLVGACPIS